MHRSARAGHFDKDRQETQQVSEAFDRRPLIREAEDRKRHLERVELLLQALRTGTLDVAVHDYRCGGFGTQHVQRDLTWINGTSRSPTAPRGRWGGKPGPASLNYFHKGDRIWRSDAGPPSTAPCVVTRTPSRTRVHVAPRDVEQPARATPERLEVAKLDDALKTAAKLMRQGRDVMRIDGPDGMKLARGTIIAILQAKQRGL
jgi:hypothetical protein